MNNHSTIYGIAGGVIGLVVIIGRTILHRNEQAYKLKLLKLQNRSSDLKKMQQFEFAKEAGEYDVQIIKLENELKSYPTIITVLNFLGIAAAGLLLLALLTKNNPPSNNENNDFKSKGNTASSRV